MRAVQEEDKMFAARPRPQVETGDEARAVALAEAALARSHSPACAPRKALPLKAATGGRPDLRRAPVPEPCEDACWPDRNAVLFETIRAVRHQPGECLFGR